MAAGVRKWEGRSVRKVREVGRGDWRLAFLSYILICRIRRFRKEYTGIKRIEMSGRQFW